MHELNPQYRIPSRAGTHSMGQIRFTLKDCLRRNGEVRLYSTNLPGAWTPLHIAEDSQRRPVMLRHLRSRVLRH